MTARVNIYRLMSSVQTACAVGICLWMRVVRVGSIPSARGSGGLGCSAGVRGLALLDAHLYVLRVGRGCTDITVHDTAAAAASPTNKHLSTLVRRLSVPALRDGADLAACPRHRCLYVADVGSDSVHRLYGLDATISFQSWPVGDKPWGLSVTSVGYTDRQSTCSSGRDSSHRRHRFAVILS